MIQSIKNLFKRKEPPPYVFKPQKVGRVVAEFIFDDASLNFSKEFEGNSFALEGALIGNYITETGNDFYVRWLQVRTKRGFIRVPATGADIPMRRIKEIKLEHFPDYTVTNTQFDKTE